ncbi:helix-turn-helix domain-containing protein [Planococcus sp. SE5232]|uniref:helix-turn-helix domain-containing protein n=1 Tax=unclassified Planococcus (in: firmicutes) TaxID=2662419 RepID=UPI003D6BCB53
MNLRAAVIKRIDNLLFEKGWKTSELIRRSGVHQTTLSELRQGRTKNPQLDTLDKIAIGFGLTLSEFFKDEVFEKERPKQNEKLEYKFLEIK